MYMLIFMVMYMPHPALEGCGTNMPNNLATTLSTKKRSSFNLRLYTWPTYLYGIHAVPTQLSPKQLLILLLPLFTTSSNTFGGRDLLESQSTSWSVEASAKRCITEALEEEMAPAISNVERRPATVEDMIEWLRRDGFHIGLLGWCPEWDPCAIFGLPSSTPGPHVLGIPTSSADKSDGQLQLESNVTMDIDGSAEMSTNAVFPKGLLETSHAHYVRTMVRTHKKLLPDALKEIDQRLVKAGVTRQEVEALTSGDELEAYEKLARLEQAMAKLPLSTRLQFRAMYVVAPGKWRTIDINLPETHRLGDFEGSMLRRLPVLHLNKSKNLASIQGSSQPSVASQILAKKPGFDKEVWAYKIAERDQSGSEEENFEGWKTLCDEEDFTELKQALLKDELKEAKIAIVCHETAFETMKQGKEEGRGKEVHQQPKFHTSNRGLDYYIGMINSGSNLGNTNCNMDVDECIPTSDVIDWNQVINAKVAGWEEDRPQ
ncbi:hypothetical protein BDFG_00698 [Blastomyces dermatitidis ATCC 26199]|nr:hypothetical protein BDFG_00698 [Blastomyces dermatitidis ATCC 26199]